MGCIQTDGYAKPSEWEEVAALGEVNTQDELGSFIKAESADSGQWQGSERFELSLIVGLVIAFLVVAAWIFL